jgi:Phage tail tube protein, GTA-gp10
MTNIHRGEIEAELGGRSWRLCLTLGALAELEHALGEPDIMSLCQRFEKGRLRAGDAIRLIGAGLRGAGHDIADDEVARLAAANGAVTFVGIVARLLAATFVPSREQQDAQPGNCRAPPGPSPGGA